MVVSALTVNTLSVRRTCPKEMFGAKTNVTFPFYRFLSLRDSLILATLVTPVVSLAVNTLFPITLLVLQVTCLRTCTNN